jgi:hypothetical protein
MLILPPGKKLVNSFFALDLAGNSERIIWTALESRGAYITRLPKAQHDTTAWQTAMRCLLHAADNARSSSPVSA